MKKTLFFTSLCCCVFILGGCVSIEKRDKKAEAGLLEPQASLRFTDIPVPMGFKLTVEDSYAFESSGIRVAMLKYQGKASLEQIVNFYKEQMPLYNWSLLNVIEYGDCIMNFDRENETCLIGLLPKGNVVTITVSLGPRPQAIKKSTKPLK